MEKRIYTIIIILLFSAGMIFSQSSEKPPIKWWLQSSLADSVKNLLFHASGQYSFTKSKGVVSGETHSGNISLVFRKGVFTNFAVYTIDKMNLSLKSSISLNYATTAHYFTDFLDVDFSKIVFAQLGFIWERDDAMLLQNRYTFYAGIGSNVLLYEKLKIKSLLAGGRLNQDYIIPVDDLDVVKEPYAAFYFRLNYDYAITPNLSLAGQIYYFRNIETKERYRYGVDLHLSIAFVKHINLIIGYNYKYDAENVLLGILPDNSMQNIGIEVSL
jgi:hypothetical protein